MGLNISGLVIDKNYKDHLTELESILGQELVFEKEVTFEESLESWKGESYCDVYFSKNGTFVLLSMEIGGFDFYADNQVAFSFVLSESTMMFVVNYTKEDELVRYFMESEDMNEEDGEPFEFEKTEEDKSELIYHLIEETLGESFYAIEVDAPCFRYVFKENQETNRQGFQANDSTKKPWWKFW